MGQQVYLFDILYNLIQANDPKNPTPGLPSWQLGEQIGPKLVEAAQAQAFTFFDDWEWVLSESDAYRWACRFIFDPRVGQWQQLKTRSNYG